MATTITLTDDIAATKAFAIVAPTDQTKDVGVTLAVTNNQTRTEQILSSLIVLSKGYTIFDPTDQTIDTGFTLAVSFNSEVSLLLSQGLTSLVYTGEFIRPGSPIIYSTRTNGEPVVFYTRAADMPVIYSSGEYGIERSINMIARIRQARDQESEKKKPKIESANELDIIDPTDQTKDIPATMGSSFNTSVA